MIRVLEIISDERGLESVWRRHGNICRASNNSYKVVRGIKHDVVDGEYCATRELLCSGLPADMPEIGVSYRVIVE